MAGLASPKVTPGGGLRESLVTILPSSGNAGEPPPANFTQIGRGARVLSNYSFFDSASEHQKRDQD